MFYRCVKFAAQGAAPVEDGGLGSSRSLDTSMTLDLTTTEGSDSVGGSGTRHGSIVTVGRRDSGNRGRKSANAIDRKRRGSRSKLRCIWSTPDCCILYVHTSPNS